MLKVLFSIRYDLKHDLAGREKMGCWSVGFGKHNEMNMVIIIRYVSQIVH